MTPLHRTAPAATARPWRLRSQHEIESAAGTVVVCGNYSEYGCGPADDAALIVLAVNNIEALADALRALVERADRAGVVEIDPVMQQARALLRDLDGEAAS